MNALGGSMRQEILAALEAAERLKGEKEIDLSRRGEELQELKAQIEELLAEVTEARVRLVSLQEKRLSLDQNVERARRVFQETESLLQNRRAEVQECLRLIGAAEEQRRGAEVELHRLLSEHQALQAHLESRKEGLLAEREKLEKAEGHGRERREALQALHEQKNTLSMKLMELDLNLKHLLSTVEERHVQRQNLLREA
jgi:chromosome segregation protein